MVFCETKKDVDELAMCPDIKQNKEKLHGDVKQAARESVLAVRGFTFIIFSGLAHFRVSCRSWNVESCFEAPIVYKQMNGKGLENLNIILQQFRAGSVKVLITTNVAARGLDIKEVDVVIQTNPPTVKYIHVLDNSISSLDKLPVLP